MVKNYDVFPGQFIGVNCNSFVGPFIGAVLYTGKNKKEIDNFIKENPMDYCVFTVISHNTLTKLYCLKKYMKKYSFTYSSITSIIYDI